MAKQSNITINWRGKKGQRGLIETTLETLRSVGARLKFNGNDLFERADKLEAEYNKYWHPKTDANIDISKRVFTPEKEMSIVKKYVRVVE